MIVGGQDISKTQILTITETSISGLIPAAVANGRADIVLVTNSIIYENKSVYFTYEFEPYQVACFPYSG